jgi:integrase
MRVGELQALRPEKVHKDHIVVSTSGERKFGEKSTKNNKVRYVPISNDLSEKLKSYSILNKSSPYIFTVSGSITPIDHKTIRKWFYRALMNIGVSREERVERNITMLSWRLYFNSQLLMKGVPGHVVRAIIGHSKDEMTTLYTNFNTEELVSLCRF